MRQPPRVPGTAGAPPPEATTAPEVLALVPARSGSKSLPHKNIRAFRGKPLLAHSILQALEAETVGRVVVSTDSAEYAEIARAYGAEVPFLRPAELAGDLSTDLEVFQHALRWLAEHQGYRPDICVHLRPTYPTRTAADIDAAVRLLAARPDADSVRSVAPAPLTPYKMWRMGEDGFLRPLLEHDAPEAYNLPRQALPLVHMQNAAVDVVRAGVVLERGSMTGTRILGYAMPDFDDIDDWRDFERAQAGLDRLPAGATFVFDLDGVIARPVPDNDYRRAEPEPETIAIVNRLHAAGNRIVLHTARGTVTGIDWRDVTVEQLRRWGVRYHELLFGKPAGDFYVDDRNLSIGTLLSWLARQR
jgi:CMP-N-acetylneuraminic acid synthetase